MYDASGGRARRAGEDPVKVFVNGYIGSPADYGDLERLGHEVVVGRPLADCLRRRATEAELADACRDADAFVYSSADTVSRSVMGGAERLRLVTAPIIGFDQVDVAAATELGILVANSPSRENARGMAEAAIGLFIASIKRLRHNEAKLRAGGWGTREDRGDMLWGKTVGLLGLGRIAREVVARLHGWDVRIIFYDPYVTDDEADELGVARVDLETLCSESDILSLHAVATDETIGIIGREQLALMKPTSFLINVARGELVDEEALAEVLAEGGISGAALDTYVTEPLPAGSPLRRVPEERLILTPHIVGHSEIGRKANLRVCLANVEAALAGVVPDNVVNPAALPRWARVYGAGA
jgi:D-3-phosphoglycerate dehydrogenase